MGTIELLNLDRLNSLGTKQISTLYADEQVISCKQIYILLVDPLTFERAGLQMLITSQPDLKLVAGVGDFDSAAEVIAAMQPDIVVLALCETNQDQMHEVKKIAQTVPDTKFILLVSSADTDFCVKAVQNGAIGVILKTQPPETLLNAIRKVNKGEAWLDGTTVAAVLARLSHSQAASTEDEAIFLLNHLTQRECEIVKLVGKGLNTRQIAKRLFLSESTIRHYLTSIYEKVGVSSRLELLIFAYQTRLEPCSN